MGILTNLFEKRALDMPVEWEKYLNPRGDVAGVNVTQQSALTYTAVYACVRILSETVASLPLHVNRRLSNGGKERAPDHYLYYLLHDSPNDEMTSMELRETLMAHLALWGNAYAEVEYNRAGRVHALWPLRPDRMRVTRTRGELIYHYRVNAGDPETPIAANNVMHLRGLAHDGIMGYSPIALARLSVGLGQAAEEFGARFFGNDARPGGILKHPGALTEEGHMRLRKSWESRHGGLSNSHRTAILEEGMDYQQIGIPPEDAQYLETRRFQVQEIARIYRVPPHMLADLERATFSNIEHQSLDFVTHTLRPWLVRLEQRMNQQLLTPAEQQQYFIEFLVDGLLRGDIDSRYRAYATARQNGWLSANDIRKLENMNPVEGGDVYLVPLNMVPANQVGSLGGSVERAAPPAETRAAAELETRQRAAGAQRNRLQQAYVRIYRDVLARILRREINDVGAAAQRLLPRLDLAQFAQFLVDFYGEHESFVRDQISAVTSSYIDVVAAAAADEIGAEPPTLTNFIDSYLDAYAARHSARSAARLRRALALGEFTGNGAPADPLAAVEEVFDDWREQRPAGDALDETVRANNAAAIAVYAASGILAKRWLSFGDSCPYCTALNGQTVGFSVNFINAGQAFGGDSGIPPLVPARSVGHPPAHRGCDCIVVAG